MIDLDFIERLIRVFDESGVDSLEIERGGTRIAMSKTPPTVAMPAGFAHAFPSAPSGPLLAGAPGASGGEEPRSPDRPSLPRSDLLEVTSPMVGTFYRAPAPDAPPYVGVGQRIAVGDTVCIIEAMKLMNELESEVAGTVVEVCIENAQPVEYGQVLFRVDPR
jgi:acetyl-CoA carboxylase biotin carboxyl carrier protein